MNLQRPYPAWRYYLSYLFEQRLESGRSEQTEHVEVLLRKGKLLLQANGAVYSWEDNYYNFREAFAALDWDRLPGNSVLVLGLGLGSVVQLAEEAFGQRLHYTAVEYDAVIAELAEHYLLYRLTSPVTTIIADAVAFVETCEDRFDLILVDLFVDDQVPEATADVAFLADLAELLRPGGCLISNRLAFRDKERVLSERYFDEVFRSVFAEAGRLRLPTNDMLFSEGSYMV